MTTSNSPRPIAVVVLAAGKGTRLPGAVPKALVECLGEPLLAHVHRAVAALHPRASVVVVGHGKERVQDWLEAHWPSARVAVQEPQNGTGHATRVGLAAIPDFRGDVVVVCADVPQLTADDLATLVGAHRRSQAAATVLVGESADPKSLGRVERGPDGRVARIVEARDATPEQFRLREFNTGVYVFDVARLRPALDVLSKGGGPGNAAGEEYLTDAVAALATAGYPVDGLRALDGESLLGVNSPSDLATAVAAMRRRTVGQHLAAGVQIVDPASTVIEEDVRIAPGARILPFTYIAHGCVIGPGCSVGPFAHLRGGTVLEEGAQIGNFVEVKATLMKKGAKAKHLTYLGDAEIGEGANIGCGTITANYDGHRKHRTTVGPGAHIGSGTVLVAPVTVGAGARTGAGTVVPARKDVPAGATVVGVPAHLLGSKSAGPAKPVAASPRAKKIPASPAKRPVKASKRAASAKKPIPTMPTPKFPAPKFPALKANPKKSRKAHP